MKKTLIAASIAALSASFVAAPALADLPDGFGAHLGATLGQPLDSDDDTSLELEAGLDFEHESGVYTGILFTTYDLLESDADFDHSTVELTLGFASSINEQLAYDLGVTFEQALDTDEDETIEAYVGANYALDSYTAFSAYFTKDLDSDIDESELEFGADYTGLDAADLFASFTLGLEDNDELTLEVGAGKEFIEQHYVTGAFIIDLDSDADDDGKLEFTYTYSF